MSVADLNYQLYFVAMFWFWVTEKFQFRTNFEFGSFHGMLY